MIGLRKIILGVVLVLVVGSIAYFESTKSRIAPAPGGDSEIPVGTALDNSAEEQIPSISTSTTNPAQPSAPQGITSSADRIKAKSAQYERVKEISTPDGFINLPKGQTDLKLASLVGKKIILVDFWTYSCINCVRANPYLNAWYEKYKDQGLEIVGVHTPEFQFEQDYANVADAVQRMGIKYPVVLDNDFSTWTAYKNRFWPRKYLIDIDGFIVYDHIGEGEYELTEKEIQLALAERALVLKLNQSVAGGTVKPNLNSGTAPEEAISQETYFGAGRNEFLGNGLRYSAGEQTLSEASAPRSGELHLIGTWNFTNESAENKTAGARIKYRYRAKNVYFVASAPAGVTITILRDGKPLGAEAGEDVQTGGVLRVREDRLYKLIHDPAGYGEHTLEIIIENPGLRAFTFTFG